MTTIQQQRHTPIGYLRRPMMPATLAGCALIGVGGLAALAVTVNSDDLRWDHLLLRAAFAAVVVGASLLMFASLRRKGRSIEEAYRLGYDVGFENGYRAGAESCEHDRRRGLAAQRREHPAAVDLPRARSGNEGA